MSTRFAASKEAFELKSISKLQSIDKPVVIKKDGDFKGVGFDFAWEKNDTNLFTLTCYCKGVFSPAASDFKEVFLSDPLAVINTTLYRQLFTVDYISDPEKKNQDTVYSSELIFDSKEMFEDDSVLFSYIAKLVSAFDWKFESMNYILNKWETISTE
jgi:hypothetical protein